MVRPSFIFFLILICLLLGGGGVVTVQQHNARISLSRQMIKYQALVAALGLTDLALTTEARYTRHPALSDSVVPGMDHPKAFDHFPSTMFMAPVAGR